MYCNPTLTSDEFKTVHNGLCRLRSIIERLDGFLAPELYKQLVESKNEIRSGLSGAYAQDTLAFDKKYEHYRSVAEDLGLKATWSLFEVDNLNDRHPYEGVENLVYRDHWGSKAITVPINGSTWCALFVAANACIRDSGDIHHSFIEGFTQEDNTLILSTGS